MLTSWLLSCTVYITHLYAQNNPYLLHKTAELNVNQLSQNGATISLMNSYVTNMGNDWRINGGTYVGWQQHVSLNNSWGQQSTLTSTLKVTINSIFTTITPTDLEVIISFGVGNTKYMSLMIRMDNNGENRVYPTCDTSLPTSNSWANGDIEAIVNTNNGQSRDSKAGVDSPSVYAEMQSMDNYWSLQFIFINNPSDNYLLFQYTNTFESKVQSCYYNALPAHQGFDIYIGTEENDESFRISSYSLDYQYNVTYTPTTNPTTAPTTGSPTNIPTINPTTSNPTTSPTEMPSNIPTNSPSNMPTNGPSNIPTNNPSNMPTNLPSNIPTNLPSNIPTKEGQTYSPTRRSRVNTEVPTPSPTEVQENAVDIETTETKESEGDDDELKDEGNTSFDTLYIIIAAFLLYICCIIGFFYCHQRKKLKNISKKWEIYNNATSPPARKQKSQTPNKADTKPVGLVQIASFSNVQFAANLTNLAGANNILMDDVVNDMDNVDDDGDDVVIGMSTKGGPCDNNEDANINDVADDNQVMFDITNDGSNVAPPPPPALAGVNMNVYIEGNTEIHRETEMVTSGFENDESDETNVYEDENTAETQQSNMNLDDEIIIGNDESETTKGYEYN